MNNLASSLSNQAKYEEAEMLYRHALGTAERLLGEEHPTTLSVSGSLAKFLDQHERTRKPRESTEGR